MRRNKFDPFCVYDSMGYIRILRIAAEKQDDIVRLLVWETSRDYVYTCEVGIGQIAEYGGRARYIVAQANPVTEAAQFKRVAMDRGATPEAVRLLGLLAPVSKDEELQMAEKLKAKGATAKASGAKAATKGDAEALKTAAKEAPVGGKKATAKTEEAAPKKRGNPEALEKARAARAGDQEAERKKKLTLVEKNNPKREGSRAFEIYAKYKTCKTVGAFLDAGGTMADVRYDSGKGFITVG